MDHTSRRSFLQLPVAAACAGVLPIGADAAAGPKPTHVWYERPAAKWEEALARDGLELPPERTRAEFTKFVADEHAFWGKTLKKLNIEME